MAWLSVVNGVVLPSEGVCCRARRRAFVLRFAKVGLKMCSREAKESNGRARDVDGEAMRVDGRGALIGGMLET